MICRNVFWRGTTTATRYRCSLRQSCSANQRAQFRNCLLWRTMTNRLPAARCGRFHVLRFVVEEKNLVSTRATPLLCDLVNPLLRLQHAMFERENVIRKV